MHSRAQPSESRQTTVTLNSHIVSTIHHLAAHVSINQFAVLAVHRLGVRRRLLRLSDLLFTVFARPRRRRPQLPRGVQAKRPPHPTAAGTSARARKKRALRNVKTNKQTPHYPRCGSCYPTLTLASFPSENAYRPDTNPAQTAGTNENNITHLRSHANLSSTHSEKKTDFAKSTPTRPNSGHARPPSGTPDPRRPAQTFRRRRFTFTRRPRLVGLVADRRRAARGHGQVDRGAVRAAEAHSGHGCRRLQLAWIGGTGREEVMMCLREW